MLLSELSFEVLQRCPNNCIYCSSNSSIKANSFVSFDVFREVVDDAVSLGLKRLCLSGGEPFLHPDLIKMVGYAKRNNLEVFIYTSGIVVDNNGSYCSLSEDDLLELSKLGVNKLIFNMQAADERTYNLVMGTRGFFDILKNSILRASSYGLFTEIHFVPMKINTHEIENVIRLANELKVRKISFLRFVLQGRAHEHADMLTMSKSETDSLKDVLVRIKSSKKIDIRIGIPLSESGGMARCDAGWGKIVIRYDGAVFPCEAFKCMDSINKDLLIKPDNVNEKRLSEIWKSSDFLNFLRNEISDFHENHFDCETCPAQWRINNIIERTSS